MSPVTLTVRLSNADKLTVEIDTSSTVLDLKTKISTTVNPPVAATQQRLIYKGRVLKDDNTLESYDIQHEHTVHMVKGAGTPAAMTPPAAAAPVASSALGAPAPNTGGTPFSMDNMMGGFGGMGGMGGQDMRSMQEQMMRNPEMMQQMMNSPMMDAVLNDPSMLQNMMNSNPQMQAMMNANPQIRQMMNDPAFLRQQMEMMRNPNAMREATRSQDLMLSQLENHPRGYQALTRMFEEVHDPMMQAAADSQAEAGATNTAASNDAPTEVQTNAVPNPWGAPAPAAPAAGGMPGMGMGGFPGFPPAAGAAGGAAPGAGGAAANPFAGMGGMGMGVDPNQMSQMMQNPMVRQQMNQMMQNPQFLEQMAQMDPQFGQLYRSNPQLVQNMFSNPDYLNTMLNPANMQAMMQMRQGMGGGVAGTPPALGANPFMGMGGMSGAMFPPPAAPAPGGLDFSSLLGAPAVPAAPIAPSNFSSPPAAAAAPAPAAMPTLEPQRFTAQLQQLQDMGFSDNEANIRALTATGGNVNAAIERLFQ